MRPHSGPFLSFLAYYMGAPSCRSVSSHRIWGPPQISFFTYYGGLLMSFFHTILGPSDHFFCILYWAPQITFFAYYMGPLRSVSSHTISGPLSDQFHCLLYAPPLPQISFFACYRGPPQILFFSQNIWGPPQISFSAYYMGSPSG